MKWIVCLFAPLVVLIGANRTYAEDREAFFESKVRPLLIRRCAKCHAGTAAKGGLRLDSREAVLEGGKRGAVVVVGQPDNSRLMEAVRRQGKLKMPPSDPLAKREIAVLQQWIAEGLYWSVTANDTATPDDPHWAYQPRQRTQLPQEEQHPIDAFVREQLQRHELTPSAPADRRTLIRRVTLDLVGLLPTPEEVRSFLEDPGTDQEALQRLMDRLLDSRHYGERWGRHWLDLVRYADTAGDAGDYPVPEAFKYRNYVIDAFNNDKPYDQFIREQIAGDLLPADDDDQRWEQTIATGYLAISRRIGVVPQNLKHITIEDTIDNLGKTFLGLTVGCARCHDHKFDQIPTSNYYALYGFFDSTVYPHPGAEHHPHRHSFVYRVGEEEAARQLGPFREALEPWNKRERDKFSEYQRFQKEKITKPGHTRAIVWQQLQEVRRQRAEVAKTFPEMDIAYAVQDGEARDVHVQEYGEPKSEGDLAPRGFLDVLGGQRLPADHEGSGREFLAAWIADPANPLTARVMVNRIWKHHFGVGIVATTNDFGIRGEPPTHPQLLDYLAQTFIDQGWSVKAIHRLILSSKTYQQLSLDRSTMVEQDPSNRWLWRFPRRRLDAEQLRDGILQLAGKLDDSVGQRHPVPHHLTYFYRQHEPFQERHPTNRRSVYMLQQRIQKHPYLDLFDGPDGNLTLGDRRETTTTLQALFLMNSDFVQEHARHIATRLLGDEAISDEADSSRLSVAYETIVGRPPSDAEVEGSMRFLEQLHSKLKGTREGRLQAWMRLVRGMLSSNAFLYVD